MSDAHLTRQTTQSGDRWDRLGLLFERALACPAGGREAFVREHCDDSRDASELRALLAAYTTRPGPLDRVMDVLGPTPGRPVDFMRTQVGPYELLREIGRGGMGVVYLARRADGLYQRLVALKLARARVLDESLRARFLVERDILAGLAHPNIAPLFDGGVTEDGLPYFTMEYVDGMAIDAYCDAQQLDVRARIRLFLRICSAVAAAHRALVVHRDLKPTNVLVTVGGDIKLLDFGIAKLLATEAAPAGHDTADDARLMTPAYASPEQVTGTAVSTATDVYALGLLLYELLCGRRAHRLPTGTVGQLERVVVQSSPMPMAEALLQPESKEASPSADAIARARRFQAAWRGSSGVTWPSSRAWRSRRTRTSGTPQPLTSRRISSVISTTGQSSLVDGRYRIGLRALPGATASGSLPSWSPSSRFWATSPSRCSTRARCGLQQNGSGWRLRARARSPTSWWVCSKRATLT
jgi:serine/threonine protein kinase